LDVFPLVLVFFCVLVLSWGSGHAKNRPVLLDICSLDRPIDVLNWLVVDSSDVNLHNLAFAFLAGGIFFDRRCGIGID